MRRRLREIAAQVVEALELPQTILEEMAHQIELADAETRAETDLVFVARTVESVRSLITFVSSRQRLFAAMSVLEEQQSTSDPQSVIALLTFIDLIEQQSKKRKPIWSRIRRRLDSAMGEVEM